MYFPKDERFKPIDKDGKTDNFYQAKSSKNDRSAGFGYGGRKPIVVPKEGPSPQDYKIESCFDSNINSKKGTTLRSRIETEPSTRKSIPGPGAYFNNSKNNDPKGGISLSGKNGNFLDSYGKSGTNVSPQNYNIKYDAVENGRFNKVTMGIGDKNKSYASSNPGVGSYNLPSCFDPKKKNTYSLN